MMSFSHGDAVRAVAEDARQRLVATLATLDAAAPAPRNEEN